MKIAGFLTGICAAMASAQLAELPTDPYTQAPTDESSFQGTHASLSTHGPLADGIYSYTEAPTDESSFQGTYFPSAGRGDLEVGCSTSTSLAVPSLTVDSTVGQQVYDTMRCGNAYAHDSAGLWYTVTGTGGGITASLCGLENYDTQLSVWTGSCSSLECVAGNDDSCGLRSSVTWGSITGQEYYVFVCKS